MPNSPSFPQNELLRYRPVTEPVPGKIYRISVSCLQNRTGLRYKDYALQAKVCRDGLQAILFEEEPVRKLRSESSLCWKLNEEEEGAVSLYSLQAKKYLMLDPQGARLSRNKCLLNKEANGAAFRFSAKTYPHLYLRCTERADTPYGYVFTSATAENATSLLLLERMEGVPLLPQGKKRLTAGTVSDIHIDYNVQGKAPYLRKAVFRAARKFRKKYDLDLLLTCGDNVSDNGSHPIYHRGVLQGKFPREKFLRIQKLLHASLQRSFRDGNREKPILWLSGNHDCQVGDRQPEGKRFNSNDYSNFLPRELLHPLRRPAPMDVGIQEELLCYEYRVKGISFLVLNTPLYPFAPQNPHVPDPHRPSAGHTKEQAEWLRQRLEEIEKADGRFSTVFVLSHYPFHRGSFMSPNKNCRHNYDAYALLEQVLNRYPNLFWIYGHVHGTDDWISHTRSSECMESHLPIPLEGTETGIVCTDSPDRGSVRSELILANGFKCAFAGSLAYFETSYFKNDGVRFRSALTELEVPFAQGLAVEVYEDRVVLTMENFGTKEGTALIRGGTYNLKPMIYPLIKE